MNMYQLPQANPRDVPLRAQRAIHKGGQSVW